MSDLTEANVLTWTGSEWVETLGDATPDSGLEHHYDATKMDYSDGDTVTVWSDLEGDENLTAPSGQEPTFHDSGLNGNPSIEFDANNLETLQTDNVELTQPNTIFAVAQSTDVTGDEPRNYVVDSNGDDTDRQVIAFDHSSEDRSIWAGEFLSEGSSDEDPALVSAVFNTTDSVMRVNSNEVGSGNAGSQDLSGLTVSGDSGVDSDTHNFTGYICELLFYDRELSADEIDSVEQHLTDKWLVATDGGIETSATWVNDPDFTDGRQMVVDDGYAYVGGGHNTDGLGIFDVSDPADPSFVSLTGNVTDTGHGVAKSQDTVFVSGRLSGSIETIDVSDPSNTTIVGDLVSSNYTGILGLELVGDTLYAGISTEDPHADPAVDALGVFDVSDPTNITEITLVEAGVPSLIYPVKRENSDYLFASPYRADELAVFDITDPTDPILETTTTFDGFDNGRKIAFDGDYGFLTDADNGLFCLDVSNPTDPALVAHLEDPSLDGARDLTISDSGDHVIISSRAADEVVIVSVDDPYNPQIEEILSYDWLDQPYGCLYHNGVVYVANADWDDGIFTVIETEGL